jgi:hypothetical protein
MSAERRFVGAAIVASGGAILTYVALILTPFGQELENLALRGARDAFPAVRESSVLELHEISMASFAIAIAIVMGIALLRHKVLLTFTVAAIMGASVGIAEIAKRVLVRPELVDAPTGWLNNSFPSGHVSIAVAIGFGAILVLPYALRWLGTIIAALYAMGIGQAVETAGWHRLSGVIGATLLVLAVASVGVYVLARMNRVQRFESRRLIGALIATVVLGGIALLFGGIGLVFGLGRALPVPANPTVDDAFLSYTATLLVGTGFMALAFLAFLWLIRPFAIDEPTAAELEA